MADEYERDRLLTLTRLGLLDTPPEREFDVIAQAAQRLLGCSMALISLVDADRQWFKAACGIDAKQTSRDVAFCAHAVEANDMLIVPDALRDPRFRDNPLVTGPPYIRFYAGVPIRAKVPGIKGPPLPIGTLCVIDDRPRILKPREIEPLIDLASVVESILASRQAAHSALGLAEARGEDLRKLDRLHRQFRQAERMANMGSWRLSLNDRHVEWSEQTFAIHGLPPEHGQPLETALSFYPPHARNTIDNAVQRSMDTGEPFDVEVDFLTAKGELKRVRTMGELELSEGVPIAIIGVFQDVTTQHQLEETLRQVASTDELTRIANRGRFNEFVEEQIADAQEAGTALALLLIDLDHFKAVNDGAGHLAGDDLLRLFAARLQASWLEGSFAARIGGDEFVLVINSARLLTDLPATLQRLLGTLCHTMMVGDEQVSVSATIGACWLDDEATTRTELLQYADAALYAAKRERRGSAMIAGRAALVLPQR